MLVISNEKEDFYEKDLFEDSVIANLYWSNDIRMC